MNKVGKESKRGGAREGSGRPSGLTKKKISVSVDEQTLEKAVNKWDGNLSQLVESLLKKYIS